MKKAFLLSTIPCILLLGIILPVFAKSDVRTVKIKAYTDVLKLFNEIGYTADQWQDGIRQVPRIEITEIPERWEMHAPHIPVKDKKNIFFRIVGSGILIANEKITAERKQLLDTIKNSKTNNDQWLLKLAKKYKVVSEESKTLEQADIGRLKNRVDIIPPALALARQQKKAAGAHHGLLYRAIHCLASGITAVRE